MVDDPAAVQDAEEVLDLVDRDGVADADVHPAAFLERAAAVDADQPALGVEQRAARVARIDRGVGLEAVGVFQQRAGRKLVAMHAGDDPVGDGRLQVGGQQEGIAHGEDPIARADLVAVAQFGAGEIVASEELDQGHVAGRDRCRRSRRRRRGRRPCRTASPCRRAGRRGNWSGRSRRAR